MIRLGICNELFEGWELAHVCRTVKALATTAWRSHRSRWLPRITDVSPARCEFRAMIEDSGLATIGLHWLLAQTDGLYLTSPDHSVRHRTADYLVVSPRRLTTSAVR